jgi:hypothetical protein
MERNILNTTALLLRTGCSVIENFLFRKTEGSRILLNDTTLRSKKIFPSLFPLNFKHLSFPLRYAISSPYDISPFPLA